jgi:hypothetical protein
MSTICVILDYSDTAVVVFWGFCSSLAKNSVTIYISSQ